MYDDAMTAIHDHLIKTSMIDKLVYTSELIPERTDGGALWVVYYVV